MVHPFEFTSPEKAVSVIKSDDKVVLSNLCSEPRIIPSLLMDRAPELRNVKIFHLRPFGTFVEKYLERGMEEHIKCCTAFTGGVKAINQLIRDGHADFYPIPLSRAPWLIRSGPFKPDVFVATMSPPDDKGNCNLGISVDYARAALETAQVVIAEINPGMPRTLGDTIVHVEEIDYFIDSHEPIYELLPPTITRLEKRIAENVNRLVVDGATIQIGYGAISESITPFLAEKRDLGLHSEMFPESAMPLVEQGILTGFRKSIHKGKAVCAFAAGTKKLYKWLDENAAVEFKALDYTNDPNIIGMNSKMTTINGALQVDLFGNIYSDMLGFNQYSGAGGQPDFVMGSQLCPDGTSIIVLPSTTSDGRTSRIVVHPSLTTNPKAPSVPTVTRFYADYVVTEYGVASLRGKTTLERARALAEIAHPDHVDELRKQGRKLNILS